MFTQNVRDPQKFSKCWMFFLIQEEANGRPDIVWKIIYKDEEKDRSKD